MAYNGKLTFSDGKSINFTANYGESKNVRRIGEGFPQIENIIFEIAGTDSMQALYRQMQVDNQRTTDLGGFEVPWKNFAPHIVPGRPDTVHVLNSKGEIYTSQQATDFNNNIASMLVVGDLPPGMQQSYDSQTGKLSVTLPEGWDKSFSATLRVSDGEYQVSAPIYFNVPQNPVVPDTTIYSFIVNLENGPSGNGKSLQGSLQCTGGSLPFSGEYNQHIIITRIQDTIPSVEDMILQVLATDSRIASSHSPT